MENVTSFEKQKSVAYFTRPHCTPCKVLGPMLKGLSEEYPEVNFYRVDIEDAPEVALEEGIMSVPVVKIFSEGKELYEFLGLNSKEVYQEAIEAL